MEARVNELSSQLDPQKVGELIPDLPFQVYAGSAGMNSSGLKAILRSPAHYYEMRYNRIEEKETEALQFGHLFHTAILESQTFLANYVVMPKFDMRTKIGKADSATWKEALKPNAIIVPEKWSDQLLRMTDKLLKHRRASEMLSGGVSETTLFWNDRETGELCKMRADYIHPRFGLIDLKTTRDARWRKFQRDILNYDYHIQAAHYKSGAASTGICRSDAFTFIAIEKEPPYEIGVYPAGVSVLGVGEQYRSKGMRVYSQCLKTKTWPGYNQDARMIELPLYAEAVDPDEEDQ